MVADRALRIAFLLPSFPAISNTFVLNQITGLLDRGQEVDIFAVAREDFARAHAEVRSYGLEERMHHMTIPRSRAQRVLKAARETLARRAWHPAVADALNPRRHGRDALSLERLYTVLSFLRRKPYDVLHCQFGNLGPAAERLVSLGATGSRLVTSFRGADATVHLPRAPERYQDLFRRGDLFLPVSRSFRDRLVAAGAPASRVRVHHSGIALNRFRVQLRRPPKDVLPTILFVGRLTAKKGVRYALEALARTRSAGRDARLTIVGEGPLEEDLRRRSVELGLADRVRFLGAQPHEQVAAAMEAAHVLIAPSVTVGDGEQEGIPNVLKEAMASGMPVVSTWHSGIPELVEHGVTGLLAHERDVEELARHLMQLLDRPDRWPEMGHAGRVKIEEAFDIEKLNDELVDTYRSMVAVPSSILQQEARRPFRRA